MNKRQLIDGIRRYNTTARVEFLAQFDEQSLRQYLEHLEAAELKRLLRTRQELPLERLRLAS